MCQIKFVVIKTILLLNDKNSIFIFFPNYLKYILFIKFNLFKLKKYILFLDFSKNDSKLYILKDNFF